MGRHHHGVDLGHCFSLGRARLGSVLLSGGSVRPRLSGVLLRRGSVLLGCGNVRARPRRVLLGGLGVRPRLRRVSLRRGGCRLRFAQGALRGLGRGFRGGCFGGGRVHLGSRRGSLIGRRAQRRARCRHDRACRY